MLNRSLFVITAGGLALCGLIACLAPRSVSQAQGVSGAAPVATQREFVPNQVLVQFAPDATDAERNAALRMAAGTAIEHIYTDAMQAAGDPGLVVVSTPAAVPDAIRALRAHRAVKFVEPNWIYAHQATSNDPYYTNGSLWGMYGDGTSPVNQYGSQAGEAWSNNHTGSSTVYVGVIDEGVDYKHPDLTGNMWVNPYDPIDGVDNDGNGYIDDVRGWDFNGNDNSTYDSSADDHGTHVAGTIGARGGNGKGVAGVNWNVQIITAKFLGSFGGTTANAIKAIDYLTDLKTRHNLNLVATNNSWGGGGFSQSLQDAIERANAAGILFVAAAGNDGANIDTSPSYPAAYPNSNILSVAAIASNGTLPSWSNYGATRVDLGAPGSSINSTKPNKKYGSMSGTSMATPHVTGAAALYASTHPGETAAQIKSAILNSTVATSSLSGKTVTGGRLNVSGF